MPEVEKDQVIYAIGDVHGEAGRLRQLHEFIFERHALRQPEKSMLIVHLGDYVDRGDDSAGVIDAIMQLEAREDVSCVSLRGNHEEMMLDGVRDAFPTAYDNWLINGGEQTMESYRVRGQNAVPDEHIAWLESCPPIHVESHRKMIFVHAGIRPDAYPNEPEATYLWTRSRRFFDVECWDNPSLDGWTIVHGHTPTDDFYPEERRASARRINIDTGAVFGGRLTAAIFEAGEAVRYMYV